MNRPLLMALVFFTLSAARADTDPAAETGEPRDETTSVEEWEAKGVIPQGGLTLSTQPLTPVSVLPDRDPYQQGLEELALAQDLWKKGKAEAASDVALQAYDDLVGVRMPRQTKKNKKKRQKLREERRQAATVYIDSSIAYIQGYVIKLGETRQSFEKGRARLADLRDVAMNYPELNRKLNKALEQYPLSGVFPAVQTSTPSVSISTPGN